MRENSNNRYGLQRQGQQEWVGSYPDAEWSFTNTITLENTLPNTSDIEPATRSRTGRNQGRKQVADARSLARESVEQDDLEEDDNAMTRDSEEDSDEDAYQ